VSSLRQLSTGLTFDARPINVALAGPLRWSPNRGFEKFAAAAQRFEATMRPLEALRAWMVLFIDHSKPDGLSISCPDCADSARRLAALENSIIKSSLQKKKSRIGIGKRARVPKRRWAHCVSAMPLSKSSPCRAMTSAPAADLPTEAVNDKGRYPS
jgi:hypothetical protein